MYGGGYNDLGFLRKPKACYRVSVCSHCSHFCFAKSTKTRTIFPPRPCKSTTDKLSTFKKHKSNRQNKVISIRRNDHISVTEPVEVTGNAFYATNSFPMLKKYKFSGQDNIICEFYEVKLGKQGFALRHKVLSEASDGLPATDRALSEASDTLPATDRMLSESSDGLPATDRTLSEASDGLPATYKLLSEASDGFTATDKALSEASDALPAIDKLLSEASDGLPATDRALSEASVGLPATDKTLSEASDAFTAIDRALSETLDGFTAIYKALSETSDAFTATYKHEFNARVSCLKILSHKNKEFL